MPDQAFSLLATISKAETSSATNNEGRLSFVDAMQQMAIGSVFDILRRPKPAFVRELMKFSDANGELAYENARCYATQIVRLYRNQLVSSGRAQTLTRRTGVRSLVEIGPSFPNLFKENWDLFCKVDAIEAKDSPVAYLTSLYRFALNELEGSTAEAKRINLDLRRPDLKDLMIDQQSTFTPVPVLNIVHEVLGKAIRTYVDTVQADKDKTLYQLIAEKQHPFLFPYNFHHQQVMLGLSGKQPSLGELSYRVSLQVPATAPGANAYGAVQQPSAVAQAMMSGLSPEQQLILLEPRPAVENIASFFKRKYNVDYLDDASNPLNALKVFTEKTGLSASEVESLLAVRNNTPYPSHNVLPALHSDARTYGASYVNGPSTAAAMDIEFPDDAPPRLINTSVERFDRLQRMIRLQRWLNIPFAELDTLVMAAISAEGAANPGAVLTSNTLRALGCYRYLHRQYKLLPEEFAAFLHHLSPYASDARLPMFDQVFNSPVLFDTPLTLDGSDFSLTSTDSKTIKTLAQLCAGLQLPATQDSLWLLAIDTRELIGDAPQSLKRNLSTISSLYRQTRIAAMFGLAAKDSWALIDLLGGEAWRKQVVTGQLTPHADSAAEPDILDILMQLDWAVAWLKNTGRDISTLRRQLGVDASEATIAQTVLDQLNQLAGQACTAVLSAEQLLTLDLPSDSEGQAIDWWPLLAPLINEQGLVLARPLTLIEDLGADLTQVINEQLADITFADEAIKAAAINRLMEYVLGGYLAQHRLVEGLLQSTADLPLDRSEGVLRWEGSSADQFLSVLLQATASAEPGQTEALAEALNTLLRHAEVNQQLGLSAQALRTFLVNPHWLHPTFSGPLRLSLPSFYLLDRYCDWRNNAEKAEERLLDYLSHANRTSTPTAKECAALLAALLDDSATEVEAATKIFTTHKFAQSMSQVDWLRRMHSASQQKHLANAQLLKATALSPDSAIGDWQAVGEAVMAANR
ncbi:Tc toxin subunit A [Pseudomonas sp. ICMP 561]|uniref:Tc toxin subunit A n=1 Tax=Pseudomonas sp. ICMP 561 TaxID=1718918 RepID=UPI000C07FCD0|nr:Tc toxin subunit A [Pseudomonas sp. ICMP 561]PHN17634.1 hypothetical protein AO242_09805 [Pseudomonas sp. ICMP 561]